MGAEFKAAPVWKKWAFLCMNLSLAHLLFAFSGGLGLGGKEAHEGIFVIGYLGVIVAVLLILGVVLTDELNEKKVALTCFSIFALVGGKLLPYIVDLVWLLII